MASTQMGPSDVPKWGRAMCPNGAERCALWTRLAVAWGALSRVAHEHLHRDRSRVRVRVNDIYEFHTGTSIGIAEPESREQSQRIHETKPQVNSARPLQSTPLSAVWPRGCIWPLCRCLAPAAPTYQPLASRSVAHHSRRRASSASSPRPPTSPAACTASTAPASLARVRRATASSSKPAQMLVSAEHAWP